MQLSDFNYNLPPELIAQTPIADRDQSRLMVLDRAARTISHHRFFELPELLDANTVLVFNQSRVIPARLRFPLGNGKGEILLNKEVSANTWECLVRPGDKMVAGFELKIDEDLRFTVREILPTGVRVIEFQCEDFRAWLKAHGQTPTPPYIKEILADPERYQTVYAKDEGSVAAPTAGLHFTPKVLAALKAKGIQTEFVTLHVGLGTFAPVKVEDITEHKLHSEWFSLPEDVAKRLNAARSAGKKIVAVGTTTVRVLESCADDAGKLTARSGETSIFIYPGYRFKFVDQLITNFHVPKSTLLMLVSAFINMSFLRKRESVSELAGRDFLLEAYEFAKKERYRFFSFGDAMFIR